MLDSAPRSAAGALSFAVALGITACAGTAPAPPHLAAAGSSDSGAVVPADGGAPADPWRVQVFTNGSTQPSAVELWPTLEHAWGSGAPDAVVAERRMCLPKGRYVFEEVSSPSLNLELTVDGRMTLTQERFPTELSLPIDVDGCVAVRAHLRNPLHFKGVSFAVTVREATRAAPCDTANHPTGRWNVCRFAGRNQEEPLGSESWSNLAIPTNQRAGRNASFDWFSIEARTTACFENAEYVFHTQSDDMLKVLVAGRAVVDAGRDRRPPTQESGRVPLNGCQELKVVHSYRFGDTLLDVAWAKVGSAADRTWAIERACAFACVDGTRCVDGATLVPAQKGNHLCVPTGRLGREGEYCDEKHRCEEGYCVRDACYVRQ